VVSSIVAFYEFALVNYNEYLPSLLLGVFDWLCFIRVLQEFDAINDVCHPAGQV